MQQLTTVGFLTAYLLYYVSVSTAFTHPLLNTKSIACKSITECKAEATTNNVLDSFVSMINGNDSNNDKKFLMAQSLVLSLINDEQCYNTVEGAQAFAESCAVDIVYEDCFEPQPIVGRAAVAENLKSRALARSKNGSAGFRIDKISDGSTACGFAWTWTSNSSLEGLRGTTFVELNSSNQIQFVREIPEPIYKPGDLIIEVLKAATADATPTPPPNYTSKTPKKANEIAKYLFNDVQGADPEEAMRFFDESIVYRDFNYEDVLNGKAEVKKFIEDFSFPGITFATQRFDDGVKATCFTWEVVIDGAPGKSALVLFYLMIFCVQYDVLMIWSLHLTFVYLY